MVLHKEVISLSHLLDITIFFVNEAGNALAALGNIHEGDSQIIFSNKTGAR